VLADPHLWQYVSVSLSARKQPASAWSSLQPFRAYGKPWKVYADLTMQPTESTSLSRYPYGLP
jgi:hypothetical protein